MTKNILFLHSASDLYGASKVAIETTKALLRNGHKVVFAISYRGPICEELAKLDCTTEIIPLATIRRKYFTPAGLVNRANSMRKSWKELKRICVSHNIDIIYSNTTSLIIGAFFSKSNGLKHIWHVHEINMGPRWLQKFYARQMVSRTQLVVAVSDAVKDHWKSLNPNIPVKRIYNGFDFSGFGGKAESLRQELGVADDVLLIGMIARVHFWKGQDYFLEMAAKIKSIRSNVKFIMVGDAFKGYEYLYERIRDQVASLDLKEDVIDLGYRTDVNKILDGIDVFILPSILPDPLPTTVLEAMASAKPVVATAHGGAVEMVEKEKTGVLIPWDNSEVAVEKIRPLIESDELRRDMGDNGLRRVHKYFSLEEFEKNMLAAINSV